MRRSKAKDTNEPRGAGQRLKRLPWAALLQGAFAVGSRWRALSASERARVGELVRESRGRPGNLDKRQRRELRQLVDRLDLRGLGRELALVARAARSPRGRRGRRAR